MRAWARRSSAVIALRSGSARARGEWRRRADTRTAAPLTRNPGVIFARRSVGCNFAVLSDAPFIKHDKRVWHDVSFLPFSSARSLNPSPLTPPTAASQTCFTCLYCPSPQSDAILDFAGNPSCEDCFDAGAYKTRGIPASPHLASAPFNFGVQARPAPSKWGRGSISTPPKGVGTGAGSPTRRGGAAAGSPARVGAAGVEGVAKVAGWRVQVEREKSPMAKSFDELGDKMRKLGLDGKPKAEGRGSPWGSPHVGAARAGTKEEEGKASVAVSLGTRNAASSPASPTKAGWTRPSSPAKAATPSAAVTRPAPVRPPLLPRAPEPTKANHATASASEARQPIPPPAATIPPSDTCAVCRLDLGYDELVELPKTKSLMHKGCFKCKGCEQQLSAGKHVDLEGDVYHKECAPPPKWYRSIVTSIKEDALDVEGVSGTELVVDEAADVACAGCLLSIGAATAVTLPTSGRTFHAACFACGKCKLALASGSQRSFVEAKGQPFHSSCQPARPPSPPLASPTSPLRSTTSRTTSTPTLPHSSSYPKLYFSPSRSSAPASTAIEPATTPTPASPSALFATRARPPPRLGGLLICSGCSVRATEKETVLGPMGRRWHRQCLVCFGCGRGLDSEARVGADGRVGCGECQRRGTGGVGGGRKWEVVG